VSLEPATNPTTDNPTTDGNEPDPSVTGGEGTGDTPEGETDPRVTRANRQAAQYRTDLRAAEGKVTDLETKLTEQGQTLAALAAVFNPDAANADPAEQLATITTEAEGLRSEVTNLRAELLVHNLAGDNGAHPVRLLDSRAFVNTLHGLDAAADDYAQQVADAIKAAVSNTPTLAADGPAPSRGGATGAGQGPAQSGAVTQEQFDAMGYAARAELYHNDPNLYARLASGS
jgi:uncharacterized coiled-coil protein SlyX